MKNDPSISSRKQQHVDLCINEDVAFRTKTTGFDNIELEYCALPELDLDQISTACSFLSKSIAQPLLISGMTGGYERAGQINGELAEVCEEVGIAMGVGSQRQALLSDRFHASFSVVRKFAPTIPIIANIGAAEIAVNDTTLSVDAVKELVELIQADALAVHLNPLQELLQPEGSPRFRGVLDGLEILVKQLGIPIAVKEVGAGISKAVASRLLDTGVAIIDVAGAGGTSWAGVELLRSRNPELMELWDYGIPTAECVREVNSLRNEHRFVLISSGGIQSGFDVAKSLALGADIAAAARPFLKKLIDEGQAALREQVLSWQRQLRAQMFVCGAAELRDMPHVRLRYRHNNQT